MKRSKHSLSHYNLLTCNMGNLIPLTWYEALPGDTIQQSTSALVRVSPLLSPVMHPVKVRIHHFFVPNRLIWEDWEDFITGGPDGTSVPAHPTIDAGVIAEGCLCDYLGVPPATYSPTIAVSALPLRAYNLIFNEYFRDQDLVTELTNSVASGTDSTSNTTLQRVAWEKDYFTTSRPWEQKGNAITIPLGNSAPVVSSGTGFPTFDGSTSGTNRSLTTTSLSTNITHTGAASQLDGLLSWNDPNLEADLSAATGIDVNDLRLALSLQRYQEARAKYGSRYVEYLRYLGVKSSDARLQNPEYLGGGRQIIQFSEVLSTDGANTGDLKGHGLAAMRTNKYRRFFEEHGIVMTLMSVVPKSIYATSLNRKFLRTTKEDYFQKELQFIGEQEITNKEVHASHATPDGTFGYQSRYDEYRSHPSSIHAEFHGTLNYWHMARMYGSDPALNSSWIQSTPTDRIYASTSTDQLFIMSNHSIQARRMLTAVAKNKTF